MVHLKVVSKKVKLAVVQRLLHIMNEKRKKNRTQNRTLRDAR
jgi:hypothetical protein